MDKEHQWYGPTVFDDIKEVDVLIGYGPHQPVGGARHTGRPNLDSPSADGFVDLLERQLSGRGLPRGTASAQAIPS